MLFEYEGGDPVSAETGDALPRHCKHCIMTLLTTSDVAGGSQSDWSLSSGRLIVLTTHCDSRGAAATSPSIAAQNTASLKMLNWQLFTTVQHSKKCGRPCGRFAKLHFLFLNKSFSSDYSILKWVYSFSGKTNKQTINYWFEFALLYQFTAILENVYQTWSKLENIIRSLQVSKPSLVSGCCMPYLVYYSVI